jgi:hypothetical protein
MGKLFFWRRRCHESAAPMNGDERGLHSSI